MPEGRGSAPSQLYLRLAGRVQQPRGSCGIGGLQARRPVVGARLVSVYTLGRGRCGPGLLQAANAAHAGCAHTCTGRACVAVPRQGCRGVMVLSVALGVDGLTGEKECVAAHDATTGAHAVRLECIVIFLLLVYTYLCREGQPSAASCGRSSTVARGRVCGTQLLP